MYRLAVVFFCFLEILLLTYWQGNLDMYSGPFLLLFSAVAISFFYWKSKTQADDSVRLPLPAKRWIKPVQMVLFFALSAVSFNVLWYIIREAPLSATDASHSDVIPSIMQIVRHFLNNEWAYKEIRFSSYSLYPTYLPMMWMPFVAAYLLKIDFRFVPWFLFWCASLYYFIVMMRRADFKHWVYALLIPVIPLLLWLAVADTDNRVMAYSVEGMIAAYYLIFSMALAGRKTWLAGMALGFCLLSRYSLVLWLPVPVIVLLLSGQGKVLWKIAGIAAAIVLCLYIIPFFSHDTAMFLKGYNYYTQATIGEWINGKNEGMWHMGNGFGFSAGMLRLFPEMPVETMVERYKMIHLAACLGITSIFCGGFILWRKRIGQPYAFLLLSFKMYIAVFYLFVQIPYKYLMIVPVAVSCALLADAFRKERLLPERHALQNQVV